MHARIDQLLSLRDGQPVASDVRTHVQQCAHCSAEVVRLTRVRDGLRALSIVEPPRTAWSDIAERSHARPAQRAPLAFAASVALFVVCAIVFVALRLVPAEPNVARASRAEALPVFAADADVDALMAQSRQLDLVLSNLPERPSVQRASLSTAVDSIEERIQWLDWQLAYSSDADLDPKQTRRLWSERVELMDSLVQVRYAESAPMAF